MRGVNRSRALVSPDCHADNSLVTAWRSGSGMAAAIVLLSGRVSETGPFLAVVYFPASGILPPMPSQSRGIRAAIQVRLSLSGHATESWPLRAIPFLQLRNVLIVRDFVLLLPHV